MKAQKAKMEMKAQKAKMTIFGGNFMQLSLGLLEVKICGKAWLGQTGPETFWQFVERNGRPRGQNAQEMKAQKAKMKGNEGLKSQNEKKWRPKRPKWKEMKAQKPKMKGNENPKG